VSTLSAHSIVDCVIVDGSAAKVSGSSWRDVNRCVDATAARPTVGRYPAGRRIVSVSRGGRHRASPREVGRWRTRRVEDVQESEPSLPPPGSRRRPVITVGHSPPPAEEARVSRRGSSSLDSHSRCPGRSECRVPCAIRIQTGNQSDIQTSCSEELGNQLNKTLCTFSCCNVFVSVCVCLAPYIVCIRCLGASLSSYCLILLSFVTPFTPSVLLA